MDLQAFTIVVPPSFGRPSHPLPCCLLVHCQESSARHTTTTATRHSTCDAHTVTLVFGTGEVNGSYAEGAVCVGQLCVDLRIVLGHTFSEHPFKEVGRESGVSG